MKAQPSTIDTTPKPWVLIITMMGVAACAPKHTIRDISHDVSKTFPALVADPSGCVPEDIAQNPGKHSAHFVYDIVLVNGKGKASNVRIKQSSGNEGLDACFKRALNQFVYKTSNPVKDFERRFAVLIE